MARIGIATFYSGNYGSILQAYALQTALQEFGQTPVIIKHDMRGSFPGSRFFDNIANRGLVDTARFYIDVARTRMRQSPVSRAAAECRATCLNSFASEQLNLTDRLYGNSDYSDCAEEADIFVAGSDQVWNPKITAWSDFYWLSFLPSDVPKFSYAPSMGVASLSSHQKKRLVKRTQGYSSISVREKSTADLLNNSGIIDKHVRAVADPTILLSADHWAKQAAKSNSEGVRKPYLFAYLLRASSEQREFARRMADERGLSLVVYPYLEPRPTSNDADAWGDVRIVDDTPWDFLRRLSQADLVLTDSFHCTLFSTFFEREFYVVPKAMDTSSQSTRITDYLGCCGLGDRLIDKQMPEFSVPDFSRVRKSVDLMRAEARGYLQGAIEECLKTLR